MATVQADYQKLEDKLEDGYIKKKDEPPDEKEEFAEPAQPTRFSYSDCFLNILSLILLVFFCWVAKQNVYAIDDVAIAIAKEDVQMERVANALEIIANKDTATLAYELLRQTP